MDENNKKLPFEVPKGYFDNLAGNIMQGVKAAAASQADTSSEWIDTISKVPVFEVPQGYFEGFATQIMELIQSEAAAENNIKELAGKRMHFEVPHLYFENFADNVMQRIQDSDEDLVDTSALDALRGINVFTVPNGYFENLNIPTIEKETTIAPKEAIVMSLPKRSPKLTNWAVAASVFFILGIGGMWMMGTTEHNGSGGKNHNSAALASLTLDAVSDEDIEQYIENDQERFDVYSLMDNASASTTTNTTNKVISSDNLLDNISQDDIDAYLEYEGI